MKTRCVKLKNENTQKTNGKRSAKQMRIARRMSRYSKRIATKIRFNSLDDDILSKIFEFVHFKQLAQISRVAKSFNNKYCQNPQWKNLYLTAFPKQTYTKNNGEMQVMDWKNMYTERAKEIKLKKLHKFVKKIMNRSIMSHSLPNTAKILHPLNIQYAVHINDIFVHHDRQCYDRKKQWKEIRSFDICNVLKIQNSVSLSEFALEDIKDIKITMKSTKLFQSVNLCFDIDSCRMKLIQNINNTKNNVIKIYSHNNIHLAVYDQQNIAFIVIALNHYDILSKIAPQLFRFDRLSYVNKENTNKNNFHGWKVQLLFRNMKDVYFNRKYYELIPVKEDKYRAKNRCSAFQLIGTKDVELERLDSFPVYLWKSEAFKGKEVGVFEIDLILLNDKYEIISTKCMMVNCCLIEDLYNFTDQSNHDKRYLFRHQNPSDHEIFNCLSGNIVVVESFKDYCNLQNLQLHLNFTV